MATDLAPSATDAHKITNTRRTSIRFAVLLCLPAIENLGEMAIVLLGSCSDRAIGQPITVFTLAVNKLG